MTKSSSGLGRGAKWHRRLATVVAAALIGVMASASVRATPTVSPDQVAIASPMMRLAVLRQAGLNDETAPVAQSLIRQSGYGAAGFGVARYRYDLSPILTRDPNMNGGYDNTSLHIGGLLFQIDPNFRARAGWMAGAKASGSAVFSLGGPFAADAMAEVRYRHALSDDFAKTDAFATLCLRQAATATTEFRQCVLSAYAENDLADSRTYAAEIGAKHAFVSGPTLQEAGAFVRREWIDGTTPQWQGGPTWSAAFVQGHRLDLIVAMGEPVQGEIAMRHRISAALTTRFLGDWTRFEVLQDWRKGGVFLGEDRHERALTIALRRTVLMPALSSHAADVRIGWSSVTARPTFLNRKTIEAEINVPF